MSLRTKILLTYAAGITLLWMGLLWLRHAYPATKHLPPSPTKTGDAISPVTSPSGSLPSMTSHRVFSAGEMADAGD